MRNVSASSSPNDRAVGTHGVAPAARWYRPRGGDDTPPHGSAARQTRGRFFSGSKMLIGATIATPPPTSTFSPSVATAESSTASAIDPKSGDADGEVAV